MIGASRVAGASCVAPDSFFEGAAELCAEASLPPVDPFGRPASPPRGSYPPAEEVEEESSCRGGGVCCGARLEDAFLWKPGVQLGGIIKG